MTLQERLEATDKQIALWQQRAQQANEQVIARQGQRALLVEMIAEQQQAEPEPRLLHQAAQ
jgi:2-keto-3-deoxy-L-rhamnonate aldolase RhmA